MAAFWAAYAARGPEIAIDAERRRTLPVADQFPATGQVLVVAVDRVWVQQFPRSLDAGERRLVFSPGGRLIARAEMPRGFQLRDATDADVSGVARDQFDAGSVERRHGAGRLTRLFFRSWIHPPW